MKAKTPKLTPAQKANIPGDPLPLGYTRGHHGQVMPTKAALKIIREVVARRELKAFKKAS